MNAPPAPSSTITVAAIIEMTAIVWDVSANDICSPRRSADVCMARIAAVGLALAFTDKTHTQIARAIGNRDHTVIGYSRDRCMELLESDREFRARYVVAREAARHTAQEEALQKVFNIDAAAVARRVISNPERGPLAASALEVRAMALRLLDLEEQLEEQLHG